MCYQGARIAGVDLAAPESGADPLPLREELIAAARCWGNHLNMPGALQNVLVGKMTNDSSSAMIEHLRYSKYLRSCPSLLSPYRP